MNIIWQTIGSSIFGVGSNRYDRYWMGPLGPRFFHIFISVFIVCIINL